MLSFTRLSNWVLRSPLLWGAALLVGMSCLLEAPLEVCAKLRHFVAADPFVYLETLALLVGLAALGLRLFDAGFESLRVARVQLGPIPAGGQPVECCRLLLSELADLSETLRGTRLAQRLELALESIARRGSAEMLDLELERLSALQRRQCWQAYGWVLVAALLLPLLGTMGYAAAPTPSIAARHLLLAGTQLTLLTLLAASALSVDLYLLQRLDARAAAVLLGRFQRMAPSSDPQVLAVRRMADAVVQVTDRLVQRQVELWQSTLEAAHDRWNQLAGASLEQTQAALEGSLRASLAEFADRLAGLVPGPQARPDADAESARILKLYAPAADTDAPRTEEAA